MMQALATQYDQQHGGPYDRGSADAWYGRDFDPHYWPQGTYNGQRVEMAQMTAQEITAYTVGYRDTEFNGKGN
jgi:hypothetical protein